MVLALVWTVVVLSVPVATLTCDEVAGLLSAGRLPYSAEGYPCIKRYQADRVDSDRATAQTIAVMCSMIRESISSSRVEIEADRAVRQWRGGPLFARHELDVTDERMLACSVWFYAKHRVKFREHAEQIKVLLNEEDQLQLLIRPDLLLRNPHAEGDCAVFTPLICAMLGALRVRYEIITVACDPHQPEVFSHVYPRAVTKDGHYLVLDASHGRFPGWEVPRAHQIRRQVWSADGQPIEDAATPVGHLGQYHTQPPTYRPAVRRVWPRVLGMGQYTATDVIDNSFGDFPVTDTNAIDPSLAGQGTSVTTLNYPGLPVPSGTSIPFNWNAVVAGALTQGINLAGKVVAPTTTLIRGPGGQLYYSAPAGSVSAATPSLLGATGGGGNLLLIGGAVVIGIIALSALSKR